MSIKVTPGEAKTQTEKPFPKLMINHKFGSIILASSETERHLTGVMIIVGDASSDRVGEYSEIWKKWEFTDYNEPITIQNA